jgi:prevent-host-death family protein
MAEAITADDAEHRFAEVLREVAGGKEFVITRDGVPVARIVPEARTEILADGTRKLTAEQQAARADMMELFRAADWGPIEHISREQLYDEVIEERIFNRRPR